MTRYVVSLRVNATRRVRIDAASPEEAVRLAEERETVDVDGHGPAYCLRACDVETDDEDPNGAWEVVGKCETCAKSLLMPESTEPPRFVHAGTSGDDDIYICVGCAAKFEADELVNGEPIAPREDQ